MSNEWLKPGDAAVPAHETGFEIAIVGMSIRFPGASSVGEFWQNVRNGVEAVSFFTDEELLSSGIDPALLNNPNYVKAKGMIEDVDLFDASFFGLNPRDAEILDPQHRFFLECAWECLEEAGYDASAYDGSIGVFAGVSMSSYLLNLYSNEQILNSMGPYHLALGNDKDYLATRVSYKLGLDGPSINVQTSCSTSLVAAHLACRSLLSGDCDMALVGGASITIPQKSGYWYQQEGISSPDGHCRAFDRKAKGTVGGNGVGVVLLKRLKDALEDRDTIHAIIKGSAVNNDGGLKAGFTAPSVDGQAQVIRTAQLMAGVEAETISYIEAHGTGTILGDPIEVAALTKAFRYSTQKKGFCAIGSVKTNIGHLDAAAGVAGLIKTTLALKNKLLPPSLHFEEPNPAIDFDNSPFYVNSQLQEWRAGKTPRRAGVSSFGIGGTNTHLILEEAPESAPEGQSRPKQLLLLSAKTPTALDVAVARLVKHLRNNPQINFADVAYTLQAGRRAFNYRRAVVCGDADLAIRALETMEPKWVHSGFIEQEHRPVAFMFPGQGTQYINMGRRVYDDELIYREHVDLCSELLRSHLGLDIRCLLYPDGKCGGRAAASLKETLAAQSALFVVCYALAKLWMSWGVDPRVMIGHSIGEYVAATLAGVFSLNDALALVAARGRLMQELPRGAMLSVSLGERQLRPLLGKHLSLASVNAFSLCVVSGPTESIDTLKSNLAQYGITSQRLHTSHAFHSEMMTPILEPFSEVVKRAKLNAPTIPYISNVTGDWISEEEATNPEYWVRHLRQTVRFADGVSELLKDPNLVLLEVGAGRTLSTLVRQSPEGTSDRAIFYSLPNADERCCDETHLLTTLGRLWLTGVDVNWPGFYSHEKRSRIPLPTYPFERQRYWVERPKQKGLAHASQRELHENVDLADWFYVPSWRKTAASALFDPEVFIRERSCWLVFAEGVGGLGGQIESRLSRCGQEVFTVLKGERFGQIEESIFAINPERRDDYDLLIAELLARGKMPQNVVHLWSVAPNGEAEATVELFRRLQYSGFYSLLFLVQAVGKRALTAPLQIWVVSTNAQSVTNEQELQLEKSTLLGPCRVIPQEYPRISCRTIDVILPKADGWQERRLVEQLLSEFSTKSPDPVVAYRGEDRWVQTFEAARLPEQAEGASPLRQRGVYLITGGLGDIGLIFAEYMARTACARLVLMSRSAFPAKQDWESLVATQDEGDRVCRRIRKLQTIEALGSEVLILSGDVTDFEQMHSAISRTYARFGDLNGVIHAAGLEREKTVKVIQQVNLDDCEMQFHPKVHGLYALEDALRGRHLDFCILMSSLSSILGGLGFAVYSAVNVFTDAFAHNQSLRNPTPWISVLWDGWRLDERTTEGASGRSSRNGFGIRPEEGVEALRRILSALRKSLVIVSTGDLHARMKQWTNPQSLRPSEGLGEVLLHTRPNLRSAYVPPRNESERAIADIWRQMLGVKEIGVHDSFFELGGHSLLATQVISRLRETLQVDLLLRAIFERPTIAELAEEIEAAMLNEIDGISEEQAQRLLQERP
jgi:acyl transferase domain-containing protein